LDFKEEEEIKVGEGLSKMVEMVLKSRDTY
jgi:hypothetical protein